MRVVLFLFPLFWCAIAVADSDDIEWEIDQGKTPQAAFAREPCVAPQPGEADLSRLQQIVLVEQGFATTGLQWVSVTTFDGKTHSGWLLSSDRHSLSLYGTSGPEEHAIATIEQMTVGDVTAAAKELLTKERPVPDRKHCNSGRAFCPTCIYHEPNTLWNVEIIEGIRLACWLADRNQTRLSRRVVRRSSQMFHMDRAWPAASTVLSPLRTSWSNSRFRVLLIEEQRLSLAYARRVGDQFCFPVEDRFRRGKATRRDVLAAHQRATEIPFYKAEWSQHEIRCMRSLIAEDNRWHEPTSAQRERMSPAAQAKYWMHHLRDCRRIRETNGNSPKTPAEKDAFSYLAALGKHALPVLIEHVDDDRPTRGDFSLGELSAEIFKEITEFHPRKDLEWPEKARPVAEFAARHFLKGGKKQAHLALVARGGRDGLQMAYWVDDHPLEAARAFAAGARAKRSKKYRGKYLEHLCDCKPPPARLRRWLWEHLDDKSLMVRAIAIKHLMRLRDPIAFPSAIDLWANLDRTATGYDLAQTAAEIMANCQPATIENMLETLLDPRLDESSHLSDHIIAAASLTHDWMGNPHTAEMREALERGLINAFWSPFANRAAIALARHWSLKSIVPLHGTTRALEAQRAELYNRWRKKNALPPIPSRKPLVARKEILRLAKAYLRADADSRTEIALRVSRHGPPVGAILKEYQKSVTRFADRKALAQLAANLDNIVWEIRIAPNVDKTTAAKLRRWIGKPPSSLPVARVVAEAKKQREFVLRIERDPGLGILIAASTSKDDYHRMTVEGRFAADYSGWFDTGAKGSFVAPDEKVPFFVSKLKELSRRRSGEPWWIAIGDPDATRKP